MVRMFLDSPSCGTMLCSWAQASGLHADHGRRQPGFGDLATHQDYLAAGCCISQWLNQWAGCRELFVVRFQRIATSHATLWLHLIELCSTETAELGRWLQADASPGHPVAVDNPRPSMICCTPYGSSIVRV